jgi:hypothetical protein
MKLHEPRSRWALRPHLLMLIGLLVAPAAQGACPSGATPSDRLATSTVPLSPGRIRVTDAEIEDALRRAFPNMHDRGGLPLIRSTIGSSQGTAGSARGWLAEHVFARANASPEAGSFRATASANAPQNDFWSVPRRTGAQIKTHASIATYLDSMQKDHLAEHFVIPDDHVNDVRALWDQRRLAAVASGDATAEREAARQLNRIRPLGRSFDWLDARVRGRVPCPPPGSAMGGWAGSAAAGAAVVVAVGAAEALYLLHQHGEGQLSAPELNDALLRVEAHGASALVTGGLLLLAVPEAPILVVIGVGFATAIVVDQILAEHMADQAVSPQTLELVHGRIDPLPPARRLPVELVALSGRIHVDPAAVTVADVLGRPQNRVRSKSIPCSRSGSFWEIEHATVLDADCR